MNNKPNDFVWVKHVIKELSTDSEGNISITQHVVIGLKDLDSGLFLISPFSDFINTISSKKTTTQIAYANVVAPFLNFVFVNNQQYSHTYNNYLNTISILHNLTLQDGIDFLTSCNANQKTKELYANILEKFYLFLFEHGFDCIQNNHFPLFKGKYKLTKKTANKDVLHNLRLEYLPLFFHTAIETVPEIALGICLGAFGGLRNSEIVSIEYDNISFKIDSDGLQSMIINLIDKDLRPDVQYAFVSKCKKNRKQEIIPIYGNLLQTLYIKHKELYKSDSTNAVFIDEKRMPMTSQTYANKFAKFKKAFIKNLENSDSIDAKAYAMTLKTCKWKTHICRGIFSNIVANNADNLGEIAIWRGDSNFASSLTYLNNKDEIGKNVCSSLDRLYKGGIDINGNNI